MALLLFSRGTPMFVAGDEAGRTQHGNNNAYNQDNEVSWLDWDRTGEYGWMETCLRDKLGYVHRAVNSERMYSPIC